MAGNHVIFTVMLIAMRAVESKVYNRCELVRELIYVHRLPRWEAALWVCLATFESSLNTAAIGRTSGDGSTEYGLFQFSDRWWCDKRGQIPCYRLIDEYLQDDLALGRTVWRAQGLQAWAVYPRCRSTYPQYLIYCI